MSKNKPIYSVSQLLGIIRAIELKVDGAKSDPKTSEYALQRIKEICREALK